MSEKQPFDKTIPASRKQRLRRAKTLALRNAATGVGAFVSAILAVLALFGIVVLLFVYEFRKMDVSLFTVLLGSFAVGTLSLALLAFFLMRLNAHAEARRLDFLERCDSPESFFVGEGTLMTFTDDGVVIHGEKGDHVRIPYAKIRFFCVCSRKRAHERGEWTVVIEMPASYLAKVGSGHEGNALIQTDLKDRLLETIAAHGKELLGEKRKAGKAGKAGRFRVREMFFMPNPRLRRRAAIIIAGGCVLIVGGVLVAVFFEVWLGVVLVLFGIFLLVRGIFSYFRARALLGFYEEGIYWMAAGRTDSLFLKWEEIEKLSRNEQEGVFLAHCPYGVYHFPCPAGSWEFIEENYKEKL